MSTSFFHHELGGGQLAQATQPPQEGGLRARLALGPSVICVICGDSVAMNRQLFR